MTTFISVWLTLRSRSDPHREALYEKQIDAISAVLSTLQALMVANLAIIVDPDVNMNTETFNKLQEVTEAPREAFNTEYNKYQWLLPNIVNRKILLMRNVLTGIPLYNTEELRNLQLGRLYSEIVEASRTALGIDPLSEDINKLIGGKEGIPLRLKHPK